MRKAKKEAEIEVKTENSILSLEEELEAENEITAEDIKPEYPVDQKIIDAWKDEHKTLYWSFFAENEFIWRKIKRKEYIKIMEDKESAKDSGEKLVYSRQDAFVKCAVLHPDAETLNAIIEENGCISSLLAEEVLMRSGFNHVATLTI